jgi:rRNA-processing protein FCF1
MKLGSFSISLPVYNIESDVTYHTDRKPTVFERMVMRLCDPSLHLSDKQSLSLLDVFRGQLGAGDIRELLEGSVSELITLGALPRNSELDSLIAPLAELELTAEGLQFLQSNRLPVRSRTVTIWHRYDPISDDIKPDKSDGKRLNHSDMNLISAADQVLKPQNPLAQVERAIENENYDWKNPATVIDRIVPVVQSKRYIERKLEITCSEDAVLSVRAPQDAALQRWLEHSQSELTWEIMLAGILTSESNAALPTIDPAFLRDARTARPIKEKGSDSMKARMCIVAQGVSGADAATPVIVLSSEVSEPTLVFDSKQSTIFTLHVPTPMRMIEGFRKLSLPQTGGAAAEVAGNFSLYWAGHPRICALAVTMKEQATNVLWGMLRQDLEDACGYSDDPRIALMPVAWRDVGMISESIWPWLATRTEQPLGDLLILADKARRAIALWRLDKDDWKSDWEVSLTKAVGESLEHTPKQLRLGEIVPLLNQIALMLSGSNAVSMQEKLLRHNSALIRAVERLKELRASLNPETEIPAELLSDELRQIWLEQALEGKELKLYGPHGIQQSMQNIEKAVNDVYRNIGKQSLKSASNGQMDARSLTPSALHALDIWRKTAEDYCVLKVSSSHWDALNKEVESWSILAQEKLAPVEAGRRIVVMDTSALMERPSIFLKLPPMDIPVVPRRVLSELDGLKTSEDEARSSKARAAIRQLEAAFSRIRHESEYLELLPVEWDAMEPDHAILSTALFFRLNEVLFVSNDINLRNKAQSLGLRTEDTKTYAPSATPEMTSRKQDKRKKTKEMRP